MNPFRQPLNRRRHYTTAPRTWVPGELVTAGMMNGIRDCLNEVGGGAVSIVGQTPNDFIYAQTEAQLGRITAVAGKGPVFNGTVWTMGDTGSGQQDCFLPASGMLPATGPGVPCGYHETVANGYGNFTGLPFSGTATQQCSFSLELPRSWDTVNTAYHVTLHVINKAGQGGNAYWSVYSGAIPHWTTTNWTPGNGSAKVEGVPGGANYIQYIDMGWQYCSNNPNVAAPGNILNFLVQRIAAAAEDTHQDFLHLVGARIIITLAKGSDG